MRFTLFRAATVLRRISHFKLSRRSDDAFVWRLFGFRSGYLLRFAHRFPPFVNILKFLFVSEIRAIFSSVASLNRCIVSFRFV